MTGLPSGWAETPLGEIAATSLGKMLDAKQRTGLHQTPYLRNINVRWGAFDLSDVATMDIEPREHTVPGLVREILGRCQAVKPRS